MNIVYIDLEVNSNNKVNDFGAYANKNKYYHGVQKNEFLKFIKGYEFICGHNIIDHDLKYIEKDVKRAGISEVIDTLPLSALLFAKRPYHKLVKDYKLEADGKNDPLIDSQLSFELLQNEIEEFIKLDDKLVRIYYSLLRDSVLFRGFFKYLGINFNKINSKELILDYFDQRVCSNSPLDKLIKEYPVELAYCLSIITGEPDRSIAPPWIVHKFKSYHYVMDLLRGVPCHKCEYCIDVMDTTKALNRFFGYDNYRLFKGQNLQEQAVSKQVDGKSIIVLFPTAGGKSITFQIPALIFGESVKGLTVVISPLQSLMNDQVKNLKDKQINDVGTINGGMNSLERMKTVEQVRNGDISLLYISPESLRSPSILKLLSKRNVVRFVIDEAHCFSTWGHDFRVDYLFIAEFIKMVQKETQHNKNIPVSCFTATAKQEVIEDISNYFKDNLNLKLEVIRANTRRENLLFYVKEVDGHKEKMIIIKDLLIESGEKAVIIYTTRRKSAELVSKELSNSGFSSTVFHAGIEIKIKAENQRMFTEGEKNIIVATSAFGMGVDKSDVSYVIHYQVSSTIEDYIQEAGRAGRDASIKAHCHILYDEKDVDAHFNLLNQQKLGKHEINQIWNTVKRGTKIRKEITISEKELIRKAGWEDNDDFDFDLTTKAKNCVLALEKVDYIKRKQNSPNIFASSIVPKTMEKASEQIQKINNVTDEEKIHISRIMSTLYTDKTTLPNMGTKPISMIDDLYYLLDYDKHQLIRYINILKENKLLELDNDLFVHVPNMFNKARSSNVTQKNILIIQELITAIESENKDYNLKELNTEFTERIPKCTIKEIRRMINFLDTMNIIYQKRNQYSKHRHFINLKVEKDIALKFVDQLGKAAGFILNFSYGLYENTEDKFISFSMIEIKFEFEKGGTLLESTLSIKEIEIALLFIHRIGALIIDGGFLVLYNPMKIEKIEMTPNKLYTKRDYKEFLKFYNNKIKKIHILVQFVKQLKNNPEKGLALVDDYFNLDYKDFEKKYITKEYKEYMNHAMTQKKYKKLNEKLSEQQKKIVFEKEKNIVVLAGPGSGKTTLLVHKLASLVRLEDVKLSELLMLTFSRAATIVFKKKLSELIGASANYIDINTFHSFCFNVIGQVGDLDKMENLFEEAIERIQNDDVEASILNKTTLVIDEAQDMSETDFKLVEALIEKNNSLRIIAVGDDDQNIYEFRHSNSKYMLEFNDENNMKYELTTNYRSKKNLVEFTQQFVNKLEGRFKEDISESYSNEKGYISIFKHKGMNLLRPVLNQLIKVNDKDSMAVLTYKVKDSEIMAGLLLKNGIQVQLLQGDNLNFKLHNLFELDWFISLFNQDTMVISVEMWKIAIRKFNSEFANNPLLESCNLLLSGFEVLYPKHKYYVDLKSYISESNLRDLFNKKSKAITVSNFHKSKGTQFKTVIMIVDDRYYEQKDLRALYVAMTRAKTNLVIHTNSSIFDDITCENMEIIDCKKQYSEENETVIQLSYIDINLKTVDYIKSRAKEISTGTLLDIDDEISNNMFSRQGKQIIYFSKKMKNKFQEKIEEGYVPYKAVVTYKVKWCREEDDSEHWLLLPKIYFQKVEKNNDIIIED